MAVVQGVTGVGVVFRRWNAGTSQWQDIGGIQSITGPSMTRGTHDTTALDTPGGYRTFITGLRDAGTITLDVIFSNAGYALMKSDFESETVQNYEMVLPDAELTSFEFEGLVTELPLTVSEAPITCRVTIKISGQVVMNSGSYSGAPA
jgi:predicted secreted protein